MALGKRLWDGGELYFDPEIAQGVPLSILLDEAGVEPTARWILAEGADGTFARIGAAIGIVGFRATRSLADALRASAAAFAG